MGTVTDINEYRNRHKVVFYPTPLGGYGPIVDYCKTNDFKQVGPEVPGEGPITSVAAFGDDPERLVVVRGGRAYCLVLDEWEEIILS